MPSTTTTESAGAKAEHNPVWYRSGATLYTLKQDGWRRGEPVIVNEHTALVQGPDAEAVAIQIHASLSANPGAAGRAGGKHAAETDPEEAAYAAGEKTAIRLAKRTDLLVEDVAMAIVMDALRAYQTVNAAQRPAPAQPPEGGGGDPLVAYLTRQWAWSKETFGPAPRTHGVVQHITKEFREIEADPHDLAEWIDVIILAMDGFWRHGGQPADLLPAMQAKQDKNFARTWPDWRTMGEDQAIEHDRSGEGPATPSAAPGGSDRERVARIAEIPAPGSEERNFWLEAAEQCGFFDPQGQGISYFASAAHILKLVSEARKQGQRDVIALTPQPASPGAGERVETDLNALFDAKPNLGAGTAEPSIREIVFGYYANHFPKARARELVDHYLAMVMIFAGRAAPTVPDAAGAEVEGTQAARDVLAERRRQVEAEGWTPEHDDQHNERELGLAAACYASAISPTHLDPKWSTPRAVRLWPWDDAWWKPSSYRRNLVKAGALILAEIERLDRATPPSPGSGDADAGGRQ